MIRQEAKLPTKPDFPQMLVVFNLAHRVDTKGIEAGDPKYIERMPKEFAVTFAKAACKRNHALVIDPQHACLEFKPTLH